jgi:hypothetical protein
MDENSPAQTLKSLLHNMMPHDAAARSLGGVLAGNSGDPKQSVSLEASASKLSSVEMQSTRSTYSSAPSMPLAEDSSALDDTKIVRFFIHISLRYRVFGSHSSVEPSFQLRLAPAPTHDFS